MAPTSRSPCARRPPSSGSTREPRRLDVRLHRPDVRSIEDPNELLVRLAEDLLLVDREQLPVLHHQRAIDDDGADRAPMRRDGEMGIELVAIARDEGG